MRRTSTLLALGAFGSPAAAWLKYPFLRSLPEESWTPPRQTAIAEVDENQVAMGFSPRPTEAPELYARMELVPRLEEYSLGSDTCGFVSSDGNPFTCITDGASCSFSSGAIGCCESGKDCTLIKTTCIDYAASSAGSCDLPDDFHTLCCQSSALGECFTWVLSTTGSGGEPDETFTLLDCSARAGSATLLDYDPAWSRTHTFGTGTTSESTTPIPTDTSYTSPTPTPTNDDDDEEGGGGGGSSTNVGAIAGGTVGGVAALALVGLVAFLFLRRRKNKPTDPAAPPPNTQQPPPNMAQTNPTSPHHSYTPGSPVSAYPSGVPSNYQPQGFDSNMAAYNQQGYQQQQGYGGYSPPPQQFQGQYPPQQGFQQQGQYHQGYDAGGYSTAGSPPPHLSPSPGVKEGEAPAAAGGQHHQDQPAQELPAVNPIGNENNRAELG